MKWSMPRPLFNAVPSLPVPHHGDTWQCCDHYLAALPQAPYCRERSLPYWLSDQCDLQLSFSTPKVMKHVGLVLSDAPEGWSGVIAFYWLQANHIVEMRNHMAVCLQVCVRTHVHTDSFRDMCPCLALLVELQKMWEGLAMTAMVLSSELESVFANARSVLVFVSLQLTITLLCVVSLNEMSHP